MGSMETSFRIHNGDAIEEFSARQISEFANIYGLDRIAPGRYSSLFIVNLYLLDKVNGISPEQVIAEIKHLEGLAPSQQTKEASEFKGPILKGLWHKHFLPALPSVFAHNIINHLGRRGLKDLVTEVFDPTKSSVVTRGMIEELSSRLVEGSMIDRASKGKLTGEWIIFAKENQENYYLCIAPHTSDDANIASNLKVCVHEFPFVSRYTPSKKASETFKVDDKCP